MLTWTLLVRRCAVRFAVATLLRTTVATLLRTTVTTLLGTTVTTLLRTTITTLLRTTVTALLRTLAIATLLRTTVTALLWTTIATLLRTTVTALTLAIATFGIVVVTWTIAALWALRGIVLQSSTKTLGAETCEYVDVVNDLGDTLSERHPEWSLPVSSRCFRNPCVV